MKQLLAIEYTKLKKLNSLKAIFISYMVIIPLWMYFMEFFLSQNPGVKHLFTDNSTFSFPHVWRFTTYSASFFNVLMGVVVVIITCNELQFKTMRQNVIDGLSKRDVILGKFMVIVLLSVLVTFYTFLVALIMGGIYSGFGNAFNGIDKIWPYLLQTLGYFSFAFLFALIVRRPALAIIFFIIYFPIETIAGAFLPGGMYQFFPLKVWADLTPIPFFEQMIEVAEKNGKQDIWILPMAWKWVLSFFYVFVSFGLSYFILRRRDL